MSDEQQDAIDFTALLAGNIGEVAAKLGALSDVQLVVAAHFEREGGNRVGLLSELGEEQELRALLASYEREKKIQAAVKEVADAAEIRAKSAETDRDEKVAAAQKEAEELKGQLSALESANAELLKTTEDQAARLAKGGKVKAPRKHSVQPKKLEIGSKGDFAAATTIVFTDPGGVSIPELPALEFGSSDFLLVGDRRVLQQAITFDKAGANVELGCVFLVDAKGVPVAQSMLRVPLKIGGGMGGLLAKRSVAFIQPKAPVSANNARSS